ncbi:hypothetical protein FNV43_RR16204 [Rhamnella rubrinervis]|uniref:Uncharacterized protein n=1 Tax=Rhamnella rubrinervis TaxID=2594499 RepID=A0A8K0GXU0_9ROSA|nr:hypothetical protein FNV43_RR16204 [Rhamnella rubrinervis]
MKAYAIVLMACGSTIAALIILCCLCNIGRTKKKKQITRPPVSARTVTSTSASTGKRDGGMVILAGADAAVVASVSGGDGDGGGDSGGGDGGGCGGGCGGCGG